MQKAIRYLICYNLRVKSVQNETYLTALLSTCQMVTVENIFLLVKTKFRVHHLLQQWFSKCGPCTSSFRITQNSLEMKILELYPRLTVSETFGVRLKQLRVLTNPEDSDGCSSVRITAPMKPQGTSQKLWTDRLTGQEGCMNEGGGWEEDYKEWKEGTIELESTPA